MDTDRDPSKEWLTMTQAAQYLRISVSMVRRYFDAERLNGWRTDAGTRRIYKDATARQLKERIAARLRRTPEPL